MSRIRSIKPEFFQNEQLAELPILCRILFPALWCLADRDGRLEDRPKRIKIAALPYDDCDCDELLGALQEGGFIDRYEAEGVRIIQVCTFRKHQRITGSEAESPSVLPANPSRNTEETPGKQLGNAEETPRTTGKEGRKGRERNGMEWNGKGVMGKTKVAAGQSLPTTKPPTNFANAVSDGKTGKRKNYPVPEDNEAPVFGIHRGAPPEQRTVGHPPPRVPKGGKKIRGFGSVDEHVEADLSRQLMEAVKAKDEAAQAAIKLKLDEIRGVAS